MFRALALPYLVPIESETGLVRELEEHDSLRILCGFKGHTPSRAMFWHFRHTPPGFYPDVMLKVLVSLSLAAESLDLALPCVRAIVGRRVEPAGKHLTIRLSPYGPGIDVWTTPRDGFLLVLQTAGKPVGELYRELKSREAPRKRKALSAQLELPAEVAVAAGDRELLRFAIHTPDWLRAGSGRQTRSMDTLTTVGHARTGPYAACNVVVLRRHEDAQQVLLSRRVHGSWKDEYVLPGGKAKDDESLEECAKRELLEETALELANSKPISIHLVRMPARPQVFSVGAVVTEFAGSLRLKEPQHNENWQWFDLDDLPTPLSLPAELALGGYLKVGAQDLEWPDVEIQWRRSGHQPVQLTLESLLESPSYGLAD